MIPAPRQWFTASTDPDAVFERTAAEPVDFGGKIGKCIRARRGELRILGGQPEVYAVGESEWVALSVIDALMDRDKAALYLAKRQPR